MGYDESGRQSPLPNEARVITRFFRGSFVIFAKGSIYNSNSRTYDARHDKQTDKRFRAHIQEVIDYLEQETKKS